MMRDKGFTSSATDGPKFELRIVSAQEIDALASFQNRAFRELPDKRFVYERDRSYFEALLAGAGVVIGAFAGAEIVGFSTFEFRPSADKVAQLAPFIPPRERHAVAINGTTLVDRHCRGSGLGRRLHTERLRIMGERGFLHAIGLVFALNHCSLALSFRVGRFVKSTWIDHDGLNLVTHLDLRRPRVRRQPSSTDRRVELTDSVGHRAALADGFWGYSVQIDDQRRSLIYGLFDTDP